MEAVSNEGHAGNCAEVRFLSGGIAGVRAESGRYAAPSRSASVRAVPLVAVVGCAESSRLLRHYFPFDSNGVVTLLTITLGDCGLRLTTEHFVRRNAVTDAQKELKLVATTPTILTLRDAYFGRRSLARTTALIGAGAGLISLCAQISFPLPFTPVPVTGQTFAVLLVGASLGSLEGTLSASLYFFAGGLGAPIFAGQAHGWHVATSASGGYLVGFIIAAAATGTLAEHGWDRRFSSSVGALLTGNIII